MLTGSEGQHERPYPLHHSIRPLFSSSYSSPLLGGFAICSFTAISDSISFSSSALFSSSFFQTAFLFAAVNADVEMPCELLFILL